MSTLQRVWIFYLATVIAVAVLVPGGGAPAHRPVAFAVLHAGLLVLHVGVGVYERYGSGGRARLVRCVAAVVSLPVVFSSLGLILPGVNPQPWEWTWMVLDRALFGIDPTVALQGCLTAWFTEALQWCYASFYLLPIGACVCVAAARGSALFDRAVTIVVFGFLLSYLGYLLFPTLPPYRFLDHGPPLEGVWLCREINELLYAAEWNRWDCFPSGHTMMSIVSVCVLWRWAPRWLWLFAPVAGLLVFSTMSLRYHWLIDVAAGALLVVPALRLGDFLLDRDGAPAA